METLCQPLTVSNDDLLRKTLQLLQKSHSEELIPGIVSALEVFAESWDVMNSMIPSLTIGVMLNRSLFPDYPESYLRKYLRLIGEDASALHVKDLIRTLKDSEEEYIMIPYHIDRLIEATTPLSYNNIEELMEWFVSSQKDQKAPSISYDLVYNYLKEKLNEGIGAPVPRHVIDNKLEDIPKTYPVLTEDDIKPMTMAKYEELMKGTEIGDRNIKNLEDMSAVERKETLSRMNYVDPEILATLLESRDLYRIFGPPNPSPDYDFSEITDLNRYGGERMLLDSSYDADEDSEDWFTGKCSSCKQNIKSRRFACRIPVPQGGWRGCYCSWNHVKKDILDAREEATAAVTDPEFAPFVEDDSMSDLQVAMIDQLIKEIAKIGIFAVVSKDDIPVNVPEKPTTSRRKPRGQTSVSKLGKIFKEISLE